MERQPSSVETTVRIRPGAQAERPPAARGDEPFRLLVVADFSGRTGRAPAEELAGRRPRRVDRDDVEAVLAQLEPELSLATPAKGVRLALSPRGLDDLHPDALWERLSVFADLRSLRRRLSDPATFAQAAAEIGRPVRAGGAEPAPAPERAPRAAPPAEDALEAALAATESAQPGTGSELVDAILAELVVPRVPATPGQAELIASLDEAAAETMRALLAAPELRRLETAWRSLDLLVRRLETDARLQVWILDATSEELVRDLVAHEDPRASGLWRAALEPDAADDGPRWAAWAALELSFGAKPASLALLARLGRLAETAGAPLLAGAHESLVGCASIAARPDPHDWGAVAPEAEAAWSAVRTSSGGPWLALALPRLLLRSPYGARTSPVEGFAFEELGDGAPDHERFLWGSGALAPLVALGHAFSADGWSLATEAQWELDRLPVPVVRDADGESAVQPAAEVVLSDRARQRLATAGLVPLASVRDADRVRFGPLRSVAGSPLAGRWGG